VQRPNRGPTSDYLVRLLVVGGAYYVSARLGLELALVGRSVTPLWPPTGLAVVAFLAGGRRLWPAVTLAAFAVNVPISPTMGAAFAIAVGNTLAPLAAAAVLRRVGFHRDLARVRDAVALVAVALSCMTISATIGTFTLDVSNAVAGFRFVDTWWVWWTGDAMGVLIVAPFLWSLPSLWAVRRTAPNWRRLAEAGALYSLLAVATVLVSRMSDPILFVVLPLLAGVAWRFEQRGAAPAGCLVSVIVILAAVNKSPLFARETLLHKMVVLQSFNAVVSFTAFFFAAAVAGRRQLFEQVYERERRISETLQRSLLPEELPVIPGVEICARYVPATSEANIGGDWYDTFPVNHGRIGVVVGDVFGHGLGAAAAMAQLRMALRADAPAAHGPAQALEHLNWLIGEMNPGLLATLVYAEFDPATGEVRFARAGHPPLLIVDHGGGVRFLDGGLGPPVGVVANAGYAEAVHRLDTGDAMFLFTDGLVERRLEPLEHRLELLGRAASHPAPDLEATCDHVIATMLAEGVADDVAVLVFRPVSLAGEVLRLVRPARPSAVPDVRHLVRRWLVENGASADEADDVLVACTEAHANVVRHAYRHDDGLVEIEASVEAPDVVIIVRDHGTWREPDPSRTEDGGRGLQLIRALMDATEISSNRDGTEIRMRRCLSVLV
jgi:integral membrane sensor domain MASE1/anti-sigma regulatory factor (Ser/Thr protein kinase)